jgi:hypothetical protein
MIILKRYTLSEMDGTYITCTRGMIQAHKIFVRKPQCKGHFGKRRCRYEDNIKVHLRSVGCEDEDWIQLTQDRF